MTYSFRMSGLYHHFRQQPSHGMILTTMKMFPLYLFWRFFRFVNCNCDKAVSIQSTNILDLPQIRTYIFPTNPTMSKLNEGDVRLSETPCRDSLKLSFRTHVSQFRYQLCCIGRKRKKMGLRLVDWIPKINLSCN